MRNICLFGGTFDPVHQAHIALAESVCNQYNISRFLFIPAKIAPHKQQVESAPPAHRLAMLKIALRDHPQLGFSDCELHREGISYTFDTVCALQKELFSQFHHWYYLIGSDNLLSFKSWYRWNELLDRIIFLVAPRPGFSIENADPEILKRVEVLDTAFYDISATELRKNVSHFESGWLHPAVVEYIKTHHLYGA
jgi:nicotinate-nucleotide adenylyltransferase